MCHRDHIFYAVLSKYVPGKVLWEAESESLRNYYYFYFPTKQWGRTVLEATCQVWCRQGLLHISSESPHSWVLVRGLRVRDAENPRCGCWLDGKIGSQGDAHQHGQLRPCLCGAVRSAWLPQTPQHTGHWGGGQAQGLPWLRPQGHGQSSGVWGAGGPRGVSRAAERRSPGRQSGLHLPVPLPPLETQGLQSLLHSLWRLGICCFPNMIRCAVDGPLGSVGSHIFCRMVLTMAVNAAGCMTPGGLASRAWVSSCCPALWALGLLRPRHRLAETEGTDRRSSGHVAWGRGPQLTSAEVVGVIWKGGCTAESRHRDVACASVHTGPQA